MDEYARADGSLTNGRLQATHAVANASCRSQNAESGRESGCEEGNDKERAGCRDLAELGGASEGEAPR